MIQKSFLSQLMASNEEERRKTALLAKKARQLLYEAIQPEDQVKQNEAHSQNRLIVGELLRTISSPTQALLLELWEVAVPHQELTHSLNVATYTVLLALSFGKSDPPLIADLGLAGLLHDIGLSQIPCKTAAIPWAQLNPKMAETYFSHVKAGLEMMDAFGSNLPERVRSLVAQHHEKGNVGLPAQLLAMTELIDSISSGQYDGVQRSYRDALNQLEAQEKSNPKIRSFHPETLQAVLLWTTQKKL